MVKNNSDISITHSRYIKFSNNGMLQDLAESREKWLHNHNTLIAVRKNPNANLLKHLKVSMVKQIHE